MGKARMTSQQRSYLKQRVQEAFSETMFHLTTQEAESWPTLKQVLDENGVLVDFGPIIEYVLGRKFDTNHDRKYQNGPMIKTPKLPYMNIDPWSFIPNTDPGKQALMKFVSDFKMQRSSYQDKLEKKLAETLDVIMLGDADQALAILEAFRGFCTDLVKTSSLNEEAAITKRKK